MSKPTEGFVIESTPTVDLGVHWLRKAYAVVEGWGGIPAILVVPRGLHNEAYRLVKISGITSIEIVPNDKNDVDEWWLTSLAGGPDRVTFWSPGACG